MTIPAFATIGYTVPLGQKTAAEVITSMAQDVGASAGTGPLEYMQWDKAVKDLTALSPDGLTVRRMITLPTPKAINGQFPYPDENALLGCLLHLYRAQLEGFCGTTVTSLPPVLFDTPQTILGLSLDTWWHAGAAPDQVAAPNVFNAAAWVGDGLIGVGRTLAQANPALQFALSAADAAFNERDVASAPDSARIMSTVVPAAIAQPFSMAVIGLVNAGSVFYSGRAADNTTLKRAGANLTYSTDGANFVSTTAPNTGVALFLGSTANGIASSIHKSATQTPNANAGVGVPDGVSLGNDTGGASGVQGSFADLILGSGTNAWTDAQWAALYAYAQGWYGVDYF